MIQRFTLQEDEGGFIINSRLETVLENGEPLFIDEEKTIPQKKMKVQMVEMYIQVSEDSVYKRVAIPRKHLVALFNKMKEIEKQELEYVKSQAA